YHDMTQGLMIYLVESGAPLEETTGDLGQLGVLSDRVRRRRVDSVDSLVEKVRIFDAGLDDIVIEALKTLSFSRLRGQLPPGAELYFSELKESSFVFAVVDREGPKGG